MNLDKKICLNFNQRLMAALRNSFSVITDDFSISLQMVHFTLNGVLVDTGWHTHKYFELGIPLNHRIRYTIGTADHLLGADDAYYLLIPKGERHQRQTVVANSACLGFIVDIHSNSEQMLRKLNYRLKIRDYKLATSEESDRIFAKINTELDSKNNPLADAMLFLLLQQFMLVLLRDNLPEFFQDKSTAPNERDLLVVIEKHIANNLNSQNLVESLSAICNITSRHLNRIFFRKHGISIKKFVIRERMKNAAWQLLNTENSVKSIALDCGFNNFSYFARQFFAAYGATPSIYRHRG